MDAPTLPNTGTNEPAGIGHNAPPPEAAYDIAKFLESVEKVNAFIAASDVWVTTPITSEELAGQLTDQISGLSKVGKGVETWRKTNKAVWDAKGQEVQDAAKPILAMIEKAISKLKAPLLAWTQEQQRIADAERQERIRIANEAAAEARRLAMDAERENSIAAQVAAEAAAAAAEKQIKSANKEVKVSAKSGSGGGRTLSTRTRNVCTIDRISQVFAHYRDDPKVAEVLLSLANAEANSKGFKVEVGHSIPGVTITETQSIA